MNSKLKPNNGERYFRYEVKVGTLRFASIKHFAEHYDFKYINVYLLIYNWLLSYTGTNTDTPSSTFRLFNTHLNRKITFKVTVLNYPYEN